MLEEPCFRAAGARRRLRRLSKGAGVTGPREQNTTAQFARRLLPQASELFALALAVAVARSWAAERLADYAFGRSGAASASPSPSRSRSRESWPRGELEPVCCSLSWPSGPGEVPHDLQRARAASLHAFTHR
eukprot:tig00000293_g23870.t1